MLELRPAIKWVGGKTQLLDVIVPLLPRNYNRYYEPFVGGAALLLEAQPKQATINDINTELTTTYEIIKREPNDLIKSLKKKVTQHNKKEPREYFNGIREKEVSDLSDIEIASRFIYLNKTGFNGLYRVNSSGKFNVPFNKKEKITISTLCNQANITRMSEYLTNNDIIITNGDFETTINQAVEGDFIFVDSPYDDSFTNYSSTGFGRDEHIRLSESLTRASARGVKWMTTNHHTKLISELYEGNHFFEVPVNRFINSDAENRANATTEVIIINYYDELRESDLAKFTEAKFFKQLKPTSFVLKDYVKWEAIQKRVNENKFYLNDLNLLHSNSEEEFQNKFNELYTDRPESFSILPLLLANRSKEYEYWLNSGSTETFDFTEKEVTYRFLEDSGLMKNLFMDATYGNVFDYLLGLEVGLTSNDKKNLTGQWMATQVEMILSNHGIKFQKEVSYESIVPAGRIKSKYFDYVFELEDHKYCVEVNFFNTTGSKINSEAARFVDLDNNFRDYEKINFVWVTDGIGLRNAKSDITNALRRIKNLFNLTTFEEFIITNK